MFSENKAHKSAIKKKKAAFFYALSIWPIVWFLVFYVYLNSSSIIYAFEKYDIDSNKFVFAGFENFKRAIFSFSGEEILENALKNSIFVYFFGFVAGLAVGQLFAYYVYKKLPGSKFYRTILYLPGIIPGIAFMLCFKYISDRFIPSISELWFNKPMEGLLSNSRTAFGTLVFYFFWQSYGGSTVIYSNAMNSNINVELVESAQLDGANAWQEYFYITFPLIFPTMQIFIITDIMAIFSNQLNAYSFYAEGADPKVYRVGYYLYKENLHATNYTITYLAAINLLVALVATPISYVIKYFTDKLIEKWW